MRRSGVRMQREDSDASSLTIVSSTDSLDLAALVSSPELKDAPKRVRSCSSKRLSLSAFNTKYLTVDEIPDYLRENPYLLSGYRREALTVRAALSTIFATHNETGNIWTHLLGGLMFAAMAVAFAFQPDPHPPASATHGVQVLPSVYPSCSVRPYAAPPSTPAPKWPQLLLLIAFSQVLLVSATCHTLCCISRKVYATIWRLDYAAISLAITATFVPFVWYAFDCAAPGIRTGYLAVACALGAVNFAVNMAPMFQHYRFRVMRLLLFIAQATWGLVPIIHATALYWGSECGVKAAITLTWAQISLNIMGAVVFATHWPERWFPGRFDTWASSHQIFHVFIVAVFLTYSQAGRVLWAWRSAKGECPVVM